jgi:hypothetical protein
MDSGSEIETVSETDLEPGRRAGTAHQNDALRSPVFNRVYIDI